MSCVLLPVEVGEFELKADGTDPNAGGAGSGWQEILKGTSDPPVPGPGTNISLDNFMTLTIQLGAGPATIPTNLSVQNGIPTDHVFFLRFGNQGGTLILTQGTHLSHQYFISVWLYRPLTNDLLLILTPQDLNPTGLPFPRVGSSQTTGTAFLFSYETIAGLMVPAQLFGIIYRADNGASICSTGSMLISDETLRVIAGVGTPPTMFQLFKNGMISGATLFKQCDIPCKLLPYQDFYVRDWTDSPASGDDGAEPSTHAQFYVTSDVWNRQNQTSGFPTATNQPDNQNALAGQTNFAYTRIWRKQAGTAAQVTANFLTAEFGSGSNYQTIGTEVVAFPSSSVGPVVSTGLGWTAPAAASSHYCMAVEISTTDDTLQTTLANSAPGPADSQLLSENNKAQRNLAVILMPSSGPVPPQPFPEPPPFPRRMRMSHYAVIHNPSVFARNLELRYEAPLESLKELGHLEVALVGKEPQPFRLGGTLTLYNMQPGENRWIGLTFDVPQGPIGRLYPVHFTEVLGDDIINGFTIAVLPSPLRDCISDTLEFHRSVFLRVLVLSPKFKVLSKLINKPELTNATKTAENYLSFVSRKLALMKQAHLHTIRETNVTDPFATENSLSLLQKAIRAADPTAILVLHRSILHELDAFFTMLRLSHGNIADIVQNVRWQIHLFTVVPALASQPFAERLCEHCQRFIAGYSKPKGEKFGKFIGSLVGYFEQTLNSCPKHHTAQLRNLIQKVKANLSDDRKLQHAHRELLLALQSAFRKPTKPKAQAHHQARGLARKHR